LDATATELEGEGVAMDEGIATPLQVGTFGTMERMNWAGTWAARRVVDTTRMDVSCILSCGIDDCRFYIAVLISRLLSRAGVVDIGVVVADR
jgi:hypothetical protein